MPQTPPFPSTFFTTIQYLPADLALTGSLVQQYSCPVDVGIRYEFEAQLYVNLSGAGIVTTLVGEVGQTPTITMGQLAEASAATALKSASGAGDQTIASGSIATGVHSLILRGTLLVAVAGLLHLDVSTGGAGNLLAGSGFRVWRNG